jgi:chemotaxis protein methyltransferase CheR
LNTVTPGELKLWAGYIKSICGNSLDESKGYLIESRLGPLAREIGCATWSELLEKVRSDSAGALRRKVINAITTNETSFFRDSAPFELLQNKIVPDLIDARKKKAAAGSVIPIRIWSAACSTGQEVYSLLIVLREMLGSAQGYDIRILGTDISDRAVAHASYGKYSRLEIERGMPAARLERHFIRDGENWRVRDEVRGLATFKNINLLDPFAFPQKFDIVLCRNVAIYFAEEDRKKLFDRIATVLAPDGSLLIGSTESIIGICPQYESKRYVRSVFYQQKTAPYLT